MRVGILTLLVLFAFGCKGDDVDPDFGTGDVRIRIWNDTEYVMNDIFVDTGGGENDYGELSSFDKSVYMRYNSAYRYAFVSFKIKGKAYTIQPIDYVGEEPLAKGKYTYRLSVDNLNSTYAILEFIED
ncbi:hypothetical protein [Jiulongibacter sediminis]|jgi:hypothetical protein|uniref:hypothetical protein n=1 Tax=Jiulongibacter sediminis TaxID=1605367 RepID=UPI0026F0A60F|nr:hypothetical protein [Jiulongibacter sediminis]